MRYSVLNRCQDIIISIFKTCIYVFLLNISRKYLIYSQYFSFKWFYLFFVIVYCCKFVFVIPNSLFADLNNQVLKSKNANQ